MLKFLCARCGQKLSVDDYYVGKMVQCPKCEAYVQVPEKKYCIPSDNEKLSDFERKHAPVKNKKTSGITIAAVKKNSFNKWLFVVTAVIILGFAGVSFGAFKYVKHEYAKRKAEAIADKESRKQSIEEEITALKELFSCIENKEKLQTGILIENIKDNEFYKCEDLSRQLNRYIYLLALTKAERKEADYFMRDIPLEDYELLKIQLIKKCKKCNNGNVKCHACKDTKVCPACRGKGGYYLQKVADGKRYVSCEPVCTECKKAKKCPYCDGTGIFIDKNNVKTNLNQYKKNTLSEIEKLISEKQKLLESF